MSVLRLRDVRILVAAVGLSALGDLVLGIPLALKVSGLSGSAFAVSAFFLALYGPIVLLGVVAGRLADRIENRRLLIVVSLVQAAAVAGLLLSDTLAVMLLLTAVVGAGVALSAPAEFALLPVAAGEERVAQANGCVESARYLGMTAGPVLGGLLAAAGRFDVAVAVDLASFLLVALGAWRLRVRRAPERARPSATSGDGHRARAGAAVLLADRPLAIALGTAIAALVFFSISMTAELFFAVRVLGAGQAGYGLLLTAWTCGMIAGAVALAPRVPVARLERVALLAVALQGAGLLGASAAGVLGTAMAGFALGGVAHGVKNVTMRTLIHRRVPEAARGRAYAAYNAARNAAELAAVGLGGLFVGLIGARAALALSGVVPLALGLAALLLIRVRRPAASITTTRSVSHAHIQG